MYNEKAMPLNHKPGAYPNGFVEATNLNIVTLDDIDSVNDCKWNRDGTAIVSVSEKNNVNLWNTEGKLRHSYQGHTEPVVNIDWKNNNIFATSSQDGVIKVWDVQSSSAIKTYNAHENNIKSLKWDYTGALLASGSEDCTVKIWTLKHDKPIYTFTEHEEMVHHLRWSPTGLGTPLESSEVRLAS
mmetsp:Transcript_40698/g.46651  ORF Transcript_40698/g.46651 Transcript_40698/m.46651 type:complete len:185 (+) Transcript_40698:725-1279(+)